MKLTNTEMSSFLMYRMTKPLETQTIPNAFPNRIPVNNSSELEEHLRGSVQNVSGGDSTSTFRWY